MLEPVFGTPGVGHHVLRIGDFRPFCAGWRAPYRPMHVCAGPSAHPARAPGASLRTGTDGRGQAMSTPTTSTPEPGGAATPAARGEPRHGVLEPPASRGMQVLAVVLGVLTVLYGLLVLSLRPAALASIAVLAAIALFSAGIAQLFLAGTLSGGWRWFGYVAGALVIIGGILAIVRPVATLYFLALVLAWSFVINGIVRVVSSLAERRDMWWFGLLIGILELLLGMWAIGSPGREVLLLVNLIGIFLIVAGIDAIVAAMSAPRSFRAA